MIICAGFRTAYSENFTTVLQNGINGYQGCTDAYLYNNQSNTNFGNSDRLYVASCAG